MRFGTDLIATLLGTLLGEFTDLRIYGSTEPVEPIQNNNPIQKTSIGTLWDALGRSGVLWGAAAMLAALGHSGMLWGARAPWDTMGQELSRHNLPKNEKTQKNQQKQQNMQKHKKTRKTRKSSDR